jgi:tRNA(His) 5'-end guanylyltransferase
MCSDEMCIFIPPTNIIRGEQQPHQRNGRVAKMMTLASGYVSARFILALAEQSEGKPEVMAALADITPHFDCRIGKWESWDEAQSLLLWRGYDCSINGVSDGECQSSLRTPAPLLPAESIPLPCCSSINHMSRNMGLL